jgi:hypothetical protein
MDWVEIGVWFTVITSIVILVALGIKGYNLIYKDSK